MNIIDSMIGPMGKGDLVVGCYLWPLRYFVDAPSFRGLDADPAKCDVVRQVDPEGATQILREATVDSLQVHITRMGGLFVKPPVSLSPTLTKIAEPSGSLAIHSHCKTHGKIEEKQLFVESATRAFNQIICELTLLGVVSDLASPVHVCEGKLLSGHAFVTLESGGRETYVERSSGPIRALYGGWEHWTEHPDSILSNAIALNRTKVLSNLSPTLPALVAGAYSAFSRRLLPEALIDAWIVIEQLLDHLWQRHLDEISDAQRGARLKDNRTYSASVRAEVLLTAKVLSESLYENVQKARKYRNQLAHRADVSYLATCEVMMALRAMLSSVITESIAEPYAWWRVTW